MLKNKRILFDFKEEIKNKYGYKEELAQDIALTAESCIEYIGEDYTDIILEAISSCKYVIAQKYEENGKYTIETVYDVAKREGMLESDENDLVSDNDFKRASGAYISIPRLTYQNGEYKIDKVDREIIVDSSFSPDTTNYLSVLAHETMHLIKAYVKEYTIDGSHLRKRLGLGYVDYELSVKESKVTKKKTSEIGVGIEEGLNSYDELCLMRQNYDSNYEVYGYAYLRIVGGFLMDNIGLKPQIRLAQITGNSEELTNLFDTNMEIGYSEYLKRLDESLALEYDRFAKILDADKCKDALDKLNSHFEDKIAPVTRDFGAKVKNEMVTNYAIA